MKQRSKWTEKRSPRRGTGEGGVGGGGGGREPISSALDPPRTENIVISVRAANNCTSAMLYTSGAGITEADDGQVTTVFTV